MASPKPIPTIKRSAKAMRSGKTVFVYRGIWAVGKDVRNDGATALIDPEVDARPQRSGTAFEHLSAKFILLHVTLKLDPKPGNRRQKTGIDCVRQCAQSVQHLSVADKIADDHTAPASVAVSVWVGAGTRKPVIGATTRYCWISVFIESLMSFWE